MKNTGEINEILVKLVLIYIRDNASDCIIDDKRININTVGLLEREFCPLPSCIRTTIDLKKLNPSEIEDLAKTCGVIKAGAFSKADVTINGEGYSIKSLQTAPPALVNHTARDGWERVCKRIGCSINELDETVDQYWDLRINGGIGEDVLNSNVKSPFRTHKEYLKPLLNYFLFKGSASHDSPLPASYILDVLDPFDTSTWKLYGEDFLDRDSHWENLVFSIRAKKGMGNYPHIQNLTKKASMGKWTYFFQDEYRGALHVRLTK